MANGQQLLAEMFGYVESLGGEGIKRGQLVPFDHPTSPLSNQEIEDISTGVLSTQEGERVALSQEVRRLKRRDRSEYVPGPQTKSAHQIAVCPVRGIPMRADKCYEAQ